MTDDDRERHKAKFSIPLKIFGIFLLVSGLLSLPSGLAIALTNWSASNFYGQEIGLGVFLVSFAVFVLSTIVGGLLVLSGDLNSTRSLVALVAVPLGCIFASALVERHQGFVDALEFFFLSVLFLITWIG